MNKINLAVVIVSAIPLVTPDPIKVVAPSPTPANSLHVLWGFDTNYLDVLETSTTPEGPWRDIPGPYAQTSNRLDYKVPIDPTNQASFFRVRRWWGAPLALLARELKP